ncbi:MAG: DUF4160 domain-containing protein [Deinococcota bacterium]|nr:DUF4160 domain-containing protein [Deinococcota bacterium]
MPVLWRHFKYGDHEAVYTIETLELTRGGIPRRAQALVLEWATMNRAALIRNWQLARDGKPLEMLEPLE